MLHWMINKFNMEAKNLWNNLLQIKPLLHSRKLFSL